MIRTTNYNLYKPEYTDAADISYLNSNADVIDTALNTHDTQIATLNSGLTSQKVYKITLSDITSLPSRFPAEEGVMDDNITSDMVCMNYFIDRPNAQNGAWTVTTYDGYCTVTGGEGAFSGSTATNLVLYLQKQR